MRECVFYYMKKQFNYISHVLVKDNARSGTGNNDKPKNKQIPCHEGVYVGVSGPNLETRAEYRFVKMIGADAVGMSTVPEVIVARHMNMSVFAISAITDLCDPDNLQEAKIEHILEAAAQAEKGMTTIIEQLIGLQ